jgi:hypothetical protein
MELLKTEYSQNKNTGKLDKILLKCDESNYYELTKFLYISYNEQALIVKALYDYNINIVLKFGIYESINKEYIIGEKLVELPNFIKYFCMFTCNDNIKNIINNKNTISNYKICYYGNNSIGILVMKEYKLCCIENYKWNKFNFEELKNIIKQVIFAIINAYEKKGFLHGDLHSGNILLKPKRKEKIIYNKKELLVNNLEAVIMDFEKSKLNQKNKQIDLIKNILKFITSIKNVCLINNIILTIDENKIINLKSIFVDDNNNLYDEFENIINNIQMFE